MKKELISVLKRMKYYWIIYFAFFIIALVISISEIKGYGVFWFDDHRLPIFNYFFEAITKLGEFYSFLFFIFYFFYKNSRVSFSIVSLGVSLLPVSYALKSYFKHPRPITYIYSYIKKYDFKGIDNIDYHTGHNSFPSGHTLAAFALFTLLALVTKNNYLRAFYLFLALMVGLSRIYLAQHFIEDVIFGSIIGILIAILIYYLFFIVLKDKKFPEFKLNIPR